MTQTHRLGRKGEKEKGGLANQDKASKEPERCRMAELLAQGRAGRGPPRLRPVSCQTVVMHCGSFMYSI